MSVYHPCISGQPIKNGTIRVGAPKAGDHLGANFEIDDRALSPASGTINAQIDSRLDDPRYYQGDTSS